MNFERIQIKSNSEESMPKVSDKIADFVSAKHETFSDQNIEKLRDEVLEKKQEAFYLMQHILDTLSINVDVEKTLKAINIYVLPDEQFESSAGYLYPHDTVVFQESLVVNKGGDDLLRILIHELWHALGGVKDYFSFDKESDKLKRRLTSVGFSKGTTDSTFFPDGSNENQYKEELEGFNEGVTEFLTQQTMSLKLEEFETSYPLQADAVRSLLQGISNKSEIPMSVIGIDLINSYFKNDLYFLKLVKESFGYEGVHLLGMIDDDYHSEAMQVKHEKISEFFTETDSVVQQILFQEICELDIEIARERSIDSNKKYASEPFNPPKTTDQQLKSQVG